jgi:hypothetical protein
MSYITRREIPWIMLRKGRVSLSIPLLIVVLACIIGIWGILPPKDDVSPFELSFSVEEALKHVEAVAQKPHPIGSEEHESVRGYLLEALNQLGLITEVQTTIGTYPGYAQVAKVHNILGRLPGIASDKAVLLVAHYDSVPTGPGAADNGASVAAVLEVLRLIKQGSPLKNDLIVLFSDAEEIGLVGANAFFEEHPWAKEVGLVINLEARGTSGPSIMFETGAGNANLIREFARAVQRPVANSLSYEIYNRLPNNTDFTVFEKAGYLGFNFAFIGNSVFYHSALDNTDNLSQESLLHQGRNLYDLTRHFGNLEHLESLTSTEDAVYFDLLGRKTIVYPTNWVIPLMIAAVLLFILVFGYCIADRLCSFSGTLISLVITLVTTLTCGILVYLTTEVFDGRALGYNLKWITLACALLTFSLTSFMYGVFNKRISTFNLSAGALLCWLILTISVSVLLPGGSYLFIWPSISSLLGFVVFVVLTKLNKPSLVWLILLGLLAVPVWILIPGMLWLIALAMGLPVFGFLAVLLACSIGLIIPHLKLMSLFKHWVLSVGRWGLTVLFLVMVVVTSGYSARQPKMNSILYYLDTGANEAYWISLDERPDDWTRQFFFEEYSMDNMENYIPGENYSILLTQAPVLDLPLTELKILDQAITDSYMIVTLRVNPSSETDNVKLLFWPEDAVEAVRVDGKYLTWTDGFTYHRVPEEGIEVSLYLDMQASEFRLTAISFSYNLPELPGLEITQRPDGIITLPNRISENTVIKQVIELSL